MCTYFPLYGTDFLYKYENKDIQRNTMPYMDEKAYHHYFEGVQIRRSSTDQKKQM